MEKMGKKTEGNNSLGNDTMRSQAKNDLLFAISRCFFLLNAHVNLFTVDSNFFWRVNTNANLISFNAENGNSDFITDHQCFAYTSS